MGFARREGRDINCQQCVCVCVIEDPHAGYGKGQLDKPWADAIARTHRNWAR